MSAKRRKQKNTRASDPPLNKLRETAAAEPPKPVITRRRKWLFRLLAMTLPLVLFFALLEAGLRLGGYGYPTTFFVGPDAKGTYTINHRFGWRFFPRSLARRATPCYISAKPADTIRIFVLGESAAMGTPDPSFSFGRILEVMLREKYPEMRFQVVNAAITAINSHVVLEIVRDCNAHQPDLYIAYMGNNEVVGPYGPGTVFQQWSPNLMFVRASIWVKATRVGQLIGDVAGYFRSKGVPSARWRGMEMFLGNQIAADDLRLTAVYKNYRRNLIDICVIARRAGAGVILSTVATNLRDCPPLASMHRSDLSTEQLAKWKTIYQAGIDLETSGRWQEAAEQYETAARIDDRFAELQFRLGRCLAAAGCFAEAGDRFISARDLDVLRFRADSRINAIIREVAADQEAAGVRLADAEHALAESDIAPDGILGGNLFYEHVHLTFDGNYLLARAVLDQVCQVLPQLAATRKQGPVPSKSQCAEALLLTPWDNYQLHENMKDMTSQPPFTNQLDHDVLQAAALQRTEKLHQLAFTPQAMKAAWNAYETALRKSPDNLDLQCRFANMAMQSGRLDVAAEHMQVVVDKIPWMLEMQNFLGVALEGCGRNDEAIARYRMVLETDPDSAEAHFNLGSVLARRGQADEAIAHLQMAVKLKPDSAEAHGNLGVVLAGRGQIDQAIAHLQKSLELKPNNAEFEYQLGILFAGRGQADEAIPHLQMVVELNPKRAEAHGNLAVVIAGRGRIDEAIAHLQKSLELKPDNPEFQYDLGCLLAGRGQADEAIAHLKKALEIKPDHAKARMKLTEVLAGTK